MIWKVMTTMRSVDTLGIEPPAFSLDTGEIQRWVDIIFTHLRWPLFETEIPIAKEELELTIKTYQDGLDEIMKPARREGAQAEKEERNQKKKIALLRQEFTQAITTLQARHNLELIQHHLYCLRSRRRTGKR